LGPVGHRTVAPDLRRFVDFFARYTMTPRGAVIRMVLRSPDTPVERPAPKRLALSGTEPPRWTEPRLRVRAALEEGPLTRADLSKAAEVSPQVVAALLKAGTLEEVAGEAAPAGPARGEGKVPALSCEQGEAARTLADLVSGGAFAPILLEGVTGSGKTEVYFEAAAAAFAAGRQALILMPEIALTPMVVARMTERFGTAPGAWHSKRPPGERARLWRGVADGSVPVVVGARSALFLPFQSLGVLVVDEEHDPSFKQEDGVIYNARDMAVVRAQMAGAPVILSSATPSVETTVNAEKGRYQRLSLPARYGGLPAPQIGVVDLRRDTLASGQWLSTPVREAVTSALAAGEQALLFLNRRGYAPLTVCRRCGHRFHCAHCAASLVDHRLKRKLVCHHCGHQENRPEACPSCKATGTLVPCGPGVERVEEEAKKLWPQ
ncbi:MAG: primosomal protein N', partial [Pseudomonadota bacterium]